MAESEFNSKLVPSDMIDPNALPPGVWDEPTELELEAHREFATAWNITEENMLGEVENSDVTLRMLSYCITRGTDIPETNYNKTKVVSASGSDGCWSDVTIEQTGVKVSKSVSSYYSAWFRFEGVTVPKGSTINYAFLRIWSSTNSNGSASVVIAAHDSAAPDQIATLLNAKTYPRTGNTVDWSLNGSWTSGDSFDSPNIACVIQELVDLPGWGSPKPIQIFLDSIDVPPGDVSRDIYDSSETITRQAELHIFFDNPAGVKISGTAQLGKVFQEIVGGGIVIDGVADVVSGYVMQGGSFADGHFVDKAVFRPSVGGGIRVNGSIEFGIRVYNITPVGGVKLSGLSPNEHSYHMHGGLILDGAALSTWSIPMMGGIVVSGDAAVDGVTTVWPEGGATVDGEVWVYGYSFYTYVASGQIVVGGPENPAKYGTTSGRFNTSGGIIIDNILDPTIVNVKFDIGLNFLWGVNAYVIKDLTFVWSTGRAAMYWYRIIGKGRQGDECDLVADPCCQKFIMNIHARTPAELCEKLSKRKFSLPIESVQRFSRPAVLSNMLDDWRTQQALFDHYIDENGNCEELIPVEICKVPQCADFCVNYDVVARGEFDFLYVMIDSFLVYESGGGTAEDRSVTVGGEAGVRLWRNVPSYYYTATGSISVEEDGAHCWPSMLETRGGLVMGGAAYTESTRWWYVGGDWPYTLEYRLGTTAESIPVLQIEEGDPQSGDRTWYETEHVLDWEDPHEAVATTAILDNKGVSEFLVVKGFDLSIPDDVSVIGIQVQLRKYAQQLNVFDHRVVLVNGDEIISNNVASNFPWPYMVPAISDYGSSGADGNWPFVPLVGDSWDLDTLRSPNFGVAIQAREAANQAGAYAGVFWLMLQVTYEDAVGQTVRVSGEAFVKSSNYHYEASGGVHPASGSTFRVGRRYITYGYGFGVPAIIMGGTYEISFHYESLGGLTVSSPSAEARSSPTEYVPEGGCSFGGEALVLPYAEVFHGGLKMAGSAAPHYHYMSSGSFGVGGAAYAPELRLSHVAAGEVVVGGSSYAACSWWSWVAGGAVSIEGSAGQLPGSFELAPIEFEFSISVLSESAVFSDDVDSQDLTQPTNSISHCGCATIPLTIAVRHNFIRNNGFYQFLVRNNLRPVSAFLMRYNKLNASWQANYHYRGLSADANTHEKWDLHYELQCVDEMGGIQLGRNIWKFAISVFRKNLTTQEDFDTRIILGLLPESICLTNDNELDFDAWIDTQTGDAIINPSSTVYQITLYDNIGLFKNIHWINNPDLILTVSQKGLDALQRRIDLTDLVYV